MTQALQLQALVLFLFYKYASFNAVGFPVLCVSAFLLSCGPERHVYFPLLFQPNYTATPVCVFCCAPPPGFTSPSWAAAFLGSEDVSAARRPRGPEVGRAAVHYQKVNANQYKSPCQPSFPSVCVSERVVQPVEGTRKQPNQCFVHVGGVSDDSGRLNTQHRATEARTKGKQLQLHTPSASSSALIPPLLSLTLPVPVVMTSFLTCVFFPPSFLPSLSFNVQRWSRRFCSRSSNSAPRLLAFISVSLALRQPLVSLLASFNAWSLSSSRSPSLTPSLPNAPCCLTVVTPPRLPKLSQHHQMLWRVLIEKYAADAECQAPYGIFYGVLVWVEKAR